MEYVEKIEERRELCSGKRSSGHSLAIMLYLEINKSLGGLIAVNKMENDDNAELISKENVVKEYKTDDLIVIWNAKECSHAGKCWQTLPQVFKPKERPWVNMTASSPEEIIQAVDKCPTDALKYKLPEGSKIDPAIAKGPGSVDFKLNQSDPIQIKMVKNGPFVVKGFTQILDTNGNTIKESNHVVLCRCGASGNQPFCDGAHSHR